VTLKTFSEMPTHMMNICDRFHYNPSSKYSDMSCKVGVNGRMDGQPGNTMPSLLTVGGGGIK